MLTDTHDTSDEAIEAALKEADERQLDVSLGYFELHQIEPDEDEDEDSDD